MRKNIALLLVLVMILSLVPMTAFAASTNSASRVPTVKKDVDNLFSDHSVYLQIAERLNSWGNAATEVFELELGEGAKWLDAIESASELDSRTTIDVLPGNKVAVVTVDLNTTKTAISIPMYVELDGAPSGEQRVFIDGLESVVDDGNVVYAIVEAGATVATATKSNFSGRDWATVGSIRIQETVTGTLQNSTQVFRLRLPRDFEWEKDQTGVTVSGVSSGASYGTVGTSLSTNGRDLTVTVPDIGTATSRISILVTPVIKADRNAPVGDVAVSLTSSDDISNASGLVIATYKDFGYTIEVETDAADDEFIAGLVDEDYVVTLTIEEDVANTLFPGRYVDVELPSWVRIVSDSTIWVNGRSVDVADDETNSFEFSMPTDTDALEFDIVFQIAVAGDAVVDGPRDIVATFSGAGMDDEVVIGTAIPSIMVEVEEDAVLQIGTQKQMAPALIITEMFPGALREGNLEFAAGGLFENSANFEAFKYEVLEGDIEIDDKKTADDKFWLIIDAESEEESVIRLYDIELTLDRTVPMGNFRLDVLGTSVLDAENHAHEGFNNRVLRIASYFQVGTPVGDIAAGGAQVAFTIGQMGYVVDGEMKLMEVAPFIADGRTMVPVRYLEELFGMQPIWNATSRTVTVMYDGKVFGMAIGSNMLTVNGAPFMEMDAEAVIIDGRTFVPASRFARAMGIPYTWDADTQTATFN